MTITENEDFPAAHSMDTAWFAVDEEGEIAIFETGEDGSIPLSAEWIADSADWSDVFRTVPVDGNNVRRIPVDGAPLAKLCNPAALDVNLQAHRECGYLDRPVILFVDDRAILPASPDAMSEGLAPLRFAGEKAVVLYCEPPSFEDIDQAIAKGEIIGLGPVSDGISRLDAEAEAVGLLKSQIMEAAAPHMRKHLEEVQNQPDDEWVLKYIGVHYYQPNWDTTLYEASYRPVRPLNISDFGDETAGKFLFPLPGVRFREAAAIQPIAFTQCARWGDEAPWLGADGSIHLKQRFKDGRLERDEGGGYTDEEIERIAIRPIGALPVEINREALYEAENLAEPSRMASAATPGQDAKGNGGRSIFRWLGFGRRS